MDFFSAQDQARRKTHLLLFLFGLALLVITQLINLFVISLSYLVKLKYQSSFSEGLSDYFSWDMYFGITFVVFGFSVLFAYLGLKQLFDGGQAVARLLGGELISRSTNDPVERQASQIVTEIAIAAGAPVPQVFLLNDPGINALAAGWDSTDAVICLTQGALKHLERDELQALVAHEFSHILSGDMRLNQTMAGLLQGLFILKEWSGFLLRKVGRIGSRGPGALLYVGILGFMLLGSAGYFFGRWIKALLAKQQEYQADAAAVQYSRNSEAVIHMLEKLGVGYVNCYLVGLHLEQFDHAFAGKPSKRALFSSHPTVEQRIHRINPSWEIAFVAIDNYVKPEPPLKVETTNMEKQTLVWSIVGLGVTEAILGGLSGTTDPQVFDPEEGFKLSDELLFLTLSSQSSMATVLGLILVSNKAEEQSRLKQLEPLISANLYKSVLGVKSLLSELDPRKRIPLIEACLPALKELSKLEYQEFRKWILILFNTDFKLDHDEFIIHRLILSRLDRFFESTKIPGKHLNLVGAVKTEFELVLSLIAHTEHDDSKAKTAFDYGCQSIGSTSLKLIPRNLIFLARVDQALDRLRALTPALKRRLLQASAAVIALDSNITVRGYELFRTIAVGLEVPLPALIPPAAKEEKKINYADLKYD